MTFDMPKGDILGAPPAEGTEGGDEMADAANDILEAIADKDAGALALALRRAYDVCAGEDDEAETDEE